MKIKSYKKKDGKTYYMFNAYVGKDAKDKIMVITRRGFETKKEAEIEYYRLVSEKKRIKECKFTFKEVYDMWFKVYKNTVRESTFNNINRQSKKHILPYLGDYQIKKIRPDMIQDLVNDLCNYYRAYKKVHRIASQVFEHGIRNDFIETNPCKKIIMPKEKLKNKKQTYLEKEQLEVFLDTTKKICKYKWYVFFRLLAFSGIRKGEALALTWNDVDFKNNIIRINKTLSYGVGSKIMVNSPKTQKSNRVIDIDIKTMSILRKYKNDSKIININNLVFNNKNNTYITPSHACEITERVSKVTGIRVTPHSFRHTHCSLLFEAGASLAEVKERLGHSSIKTTMDIYNHVSKKKKEEVAHKLAEYLAF